MAGSKRLTKAQKEEIIELKLVGLTYASIQQKTGFSISTIGRVCRSMDIRSSTPEDVKERIYSEVLSNQSISKLRERIGLLIEDDLAIVVNLRNSVSEVLVKIIDDSIEDEYFNAGQAARVLNSLANTLRLTQQIYHTATGRDQIGKSEEQITRVSVVELNAGEVAEIRKNAAERAGHQASNDELAELQIGTSR